MPRTPIFIKCDSCGQVKPSDQVYRVTLQAWQGRKCVKTTTAGYYCNNCLNKLKLTVS